MNVNAEQALSDMFGRLFSEINQVEEKALITEEFQDISYKDMHILEAIGPDIPRTMSYVAGQMNITMGTLTIAINNLVKKGYVNRTRSNQDKRVVYVTLTKRGEQAYLRHQKDHQKMAEALVKDTTEEDQLVLLRALERLRQYFDQIRTS